MVKKMKKRKKINELAINLFLFIVKWIIIPVFLLLFWVILSLMYSSYKSFTVLQYASYQDSKNDFFNKQLLQGQKLTGDFYAKENHLGIVAIRMGGVPKVDFEHEDILEFRIKEKNAKNWLDTNTYRSGGITSNEYYPFGFREISSSKGKEYIFEFVSIKGTKENAIQTKSANPIYVSKYKFPKSEVFGSTIIFTKFIKEKFITFVTNLDLLLSSLTFLLPLIFYSIWILIPRRGTQWLLVSSKRFKKQITGEDLITALASIFILFDITFNEFINIGFMIALLGFWIDLGIFNKQKSGASFALACIVFAISLASIYFHLNISFDKASAFGYLLLVIGLIQS